MNKVNKANMPNFLKLLFFVEMWERFSYYGMRALLVLFLVSHLGFADQKAYAIYSLFAAIGYAIPVLAGFISDKYTGPRKLVFIGGMVMMFGHILMTMTNSKPNLIYLSLGLIAVGTGFFKGNITNLLGSCYAKNDETRSQGFTLFHVGVNLGPLVASISCGYVANLYGWHYGFGIAALGMFIGLATFAKFEYILDINSNIPKIKSLKTICCMPLSYGIFALAIIMSIVCGLMLQHSAIFANLLAFVGSLVLLVMFNIIYKLPKEEAKNLIALIIMILFLMCFFALEMQLGSFINLFTERNVQNEIFGFHIPAAVSQSLNPFSIIVIGYFVGTFLKFNKKYLALQLLLGPVAMCLCFVVLYVGTIFANSEGCVPYIYLFAAISIMGFGEIFISPFVQSQVNILAPKNLHGFMMGFVMLSLSFSNLFGIIISKFVSVPSVNGEVDKLLSLEIYKAGFFNIALLNMVVVFMFLLFYKFLNYRLK